MRWEEADPCARSFCSAVSTSRRQALFKLGTRDYLRSTLGWIEVWLKWIHFLARLDLLGWAMWGTFVVSRIFAMWQRDPKITVQKIVATLLTQLVVFGVLALGFVMMRVSEAFLRVIPASIRYWIEATEEQRTRALAE